MDKISITYWCQLENDQQDKIIINNVSESATDQEIVALANEIIAGNTSLKGLKILKLKSCKKTVISESDISI
ncbi:MAG: hypothetical protein FWC47_12845 [Oscillospiraceae bacterium]|nr:hypothetical protein [Oscillospiraceae bacterium]